MKMAAIWQQLKVESMEYWVKKLAKIKLISINTYVEIYFHFYQSFWKVRPVTEATTSARTTTTSQSTTTETIVSETTEDIYDDYDINDDPLADDETNRRFDVLDPVDYEVVGEKCETYMGVEYCYPVYK